MRYQKLHAFSNSTLGGVKRRASVTGSFIPDEQYRYPLNVRLGGFQSTSVRCGKEYIVSASGKSFSDDKSGSDEDQGHQEGDNVDCDPTFEASCSSAEPQ